VAECRRVAAELDMPPPTLESLLSLRGVVEYSDIDDNEDEIALVDAALQSSLIEGLRELVADRNREGAALDAILRERLSALEELAAAARKAVLEHPEMLRARMAEQIKLLLDQTSSVSEDRLVQELAILATRADVREELDRLDTHIVAARDLLDEAVNIGRKLDFLCQEFNREINTLCSKSPDVALTAIGLDMKAVLEQFREQVQNVE